MLSDQAIRDSAAAAGITLSNADLTSIREAAASVITNNNTRTCDDASESSTCLTYSGIKQAVATEVQTAAPSFNTTHLLGELWCWGAFRKLRADAIKTRYSDGSSGGGLSPQQARQRYARDEQLILNRLPDVPELGAPSSCKVLRLLNCLPCTMFKTHAVVVAETEVKYVLEGNIPTIESVLRLRGKKTPATGGTTGLQDRAEAQTKDETIASVSSSPAAKAASFLRSLLPTSFFGGGDGDGDGDADDAHLNNNSKQKKNSSSNTEGATQQQTSFTSTQQPLSIEATVIWRTMHFARHDGVDQGSYEIQSIAARSFECHCVQSGEVLARAGGMPTSSQQYSVLDHDNINNNQHQYHQPPPRLLIASTQSELWWRGQLECYTRPSLHFIFAWLLYQNNKEVRQMAAAPHSRSGAGGGGSVCTASSTSLAGGASPTLNSAAASSTTAHTTSSSSSSSSSSSKHQRRAATAKKISGSIRQRMANIEEDLTVVDLLDELRSKLWLTLFDHVPQFAVLGMGGNVIANYLSCLFPWSTVHVAELEPSVVASNILNDDFAETRKKNKNKKGGEDARRKVQPRLHTADDDDENDIDDDVCQRQVGHVGDVSDLLGVSVKDNDDDDHNDNDRNKNGKQNGKQNNNNNSKQAAGLPDSGFTIIFLDCFDPVAVSMDHGSRLLAACHKRLRVGGILAVNTHLPMTNSGAELRPFCEVFGGDESVQVMSISGYQQAIVLCQKRSPAAIQRGGPCLAPQGVREFRAVARIGSACPVFVRLGGGVLRSVEEGVKFFGAAAAAAEEEEGEQNADASYEGQNNRGAGDFVVGGAAAGSGRSSRTSATSATTTAKRMRSNDDFIIGPEETSSPLLPAPPPPPSGHKGSNDHSIIKNTFEQQQHRVIADNDNNIPKAYCSKMCKARTRISDPCTCLSCTSRWLDAGALQESVRVSVRLTPSSGGNNNNQNSGDASNVVTVRRWLTR